MSSNYEIETPEYLAHGFNVLQAMMLSDSEDDHIEKCMALSGYKKGMEICDMGCGVGYAANLMNFLGYKTAGVTDSIYQYDYAINHYLKTLFAFCDMIETPFLGESFDAVQWMESIGYVDQQKAFAEAHRLLKRGGKAIVKDFAVIGYAEETCQSWSYRFVSAGAMITMAESEGLKLVKAFALNANGQRYERLFNESKVLRELHPAGMNIKATIPFWYEFVKL